MKEDHSSIAASAALVLSLAIVAGAMAGAVGTEGAERRVTAALVSDIGKFNDRGFNQNQLAGLNRAKTKLGMHRRSRCSRTRSATTSRT